MSEAQASTPCAELTRDAQDLNDDQLWEALQALQTETAQKEGTAPLLGSPWGNLRAPAVAVELQQMMGMWILEGEGMAVWETCTVAKNPLYPLQMLADSLAWSWLG